MTKDHNFREQAEKLLPKKVKSFKEIPLQDLEKLIHELEVHQIELEMQNEELRKAQLEIEESRTMFSNLYDFAPVGYFTFDHQGVIEGVNLTGAKFLNVERSLLLNKPFNVFIEPDFRDEFHTHRKKVFSTGTKQTCELKLLKKDGTSFYASLDSIALKDEEGTSTKCLSAVSDITERKRAEEIIRISYDEMEKRVHKRTEELRNINELFQSTIAEHERTEEALRASEAELHDNYFAQSAINMILSESLEDVPLEVILQKALNMILSIPWISFESIGSIHLVEDERGILVMKAQNSLPKALIELCSKIPFGKCLCGRAAVTQGIEFAGHVDERHEICYEGMTPHGHYSVPILFGGKTLGVLNIYLKEGHIRDKREEEFLLAVADTLAGIIARKKIEDEKEKLHHQLLQAQKMEAVGQLAGGIAHDFNNILTAIVSYASLLKMKMTIDDPLSSYADHILSSSERAANLTHSLLAFSRKQIMNPIPVDLNQIIRKVEKLLARIIGEDIELKTVLAGRDLTVMADPVQTEQVFMNLATNARDAMPKGGRLEIETELTELDESFVRTHGYGKTGRYALISFSDSGIGMDEMTREKIFEPFFTTKEVGKGTGLGLSMVYGIIKQHDGFINVYSELGRGTIFRIYLPLIQAKAEEMRPEVIDTIKRGSETILLVEDNSEVRASTKALLEEFGYRIIEATDGEDAIVQFNRHKDGVKLVILDVIMPKKNGREAYEEIRKIKPAVRAVFTSGYTANIIHQKGILSEGLEFIHKPISPEALLRKVREILDDYKE